MKLNNRFIKHFHFYRTSLFHLSSLFNPFKSTIIDKDNKKLNDCIQNNKPILTFDKFLEILDDLRQGDIDIEEYPEVKPVYDDLFGLGFKPEQPGPYECCGNGCDNCVVDVYHTNLDNYKKGLKDIYERIVRLNEENNCNNI